MDIKVYMTKECDYIPNGTEIYRDVTDLKYNAINGLTFIANCYTFPISRKKYYFYPNEIKFFKTGEKLSFRKKYTLVKIAVPEDKTGWKYNAEMKMWNMVRDGSAHVTFSIDTKCLVENYIQYNFNRIGTRYFPKSK